MRFARLGLLPLMSLMTMNATSLSESTSGIQLLSWEQPSSLWISITERDDQVLFRSKTFHPDRPWDQLILSWNIEADTPGLFRFRVGFEDEARQPWIYEMGRWSPSDPKLRQSVDGQSNESGQVQTDILTLRQSRTRFWIELLLENGSGKDGADALKFMAACLTDTSQHLNSSQPAAIPSATNLLVPEKSQLWYQGGEGWCSPTSVSMVLAYWSIRNSKPEWMVEVTRCAEQVYDPVWKGTGNWSFNTAYAGALPGMRAYVSRMSNALELSRWTEQGIPVICSISSTWLKGKPERGDGHLVVCRGFNEKGDIILNDPGTTKDILCVYPLDRFLHAWSASKNTVYLIYPDDAIASNSSTVK